MISLISPAKNMKFPEGRVSIGEKPEFLEDSAIIMDKLKSMSVGRLQKLMGISKQLGELNAERNRKWNVNYVANESEPSIFAFDGEVYRGLAAESFNGDDLDFANANLRILSGLYGLLRPLDIIQPYRLEMGCSLKIGRKKNLYEFWSNRLVEHLNKELEDHAEKVVLNLASNEYIKAVPGKNLIAPLIDVKFMDLRKGGYTTVMMWAKNARGRMAREIITNRIDRLDDLKSLEFNNYCYNEELSDKNTLTFTRDETP